jgi:hypothetical protein
MGRACGMHGGGEMHAGFWWGNFKERNYLEDCVDDGIILKLLLKK